MLRCGPSGQMIKLDSSWRQSTSLDEAVHKHWQTCRPLGDHGHAPAYTDKELVAEQGDRRVPVVLGLACHKIIHRG
jgi:hypothetical protein